jgi:hypothetical protein
MDGQSSNLIFVDAHDHAHTPYVQGIAFADSSLSAKRKKKRKNWIPWKFSAINTYSNSWRFVIVFMAEESALAPSFPILLTLILQVAINHNNDYTWVMLAYYNTCSLVIDFKAEDRAIAPSLPISFLLRLHFLNFISLMNVDQLKLTLMSGDLTVFSKKTK